ncbi:YihY/virulence factor BrkB family protein [Haloplanus halophilus]|uniref:YihY/virulence factor BrkB family protein n=1 Tax=Haloplanus halophilus TaxID=2949993 RepID=UPI00203A8246|nr:YihY/virulence factor BrkB family protein [Haloplanus sp. GDY1]
MSPVDRGRELTETVIAVARQRQLTVLAAGLAYHAFNSLIPAVLLVFLGASVSQRFETLAFAVAAVTGIDAARLTAVLETLTEDPTGQLRAAAIAAVVFVWSAGQLLRAMRRAFVALYGDDARRSGSTVDTLAAVGLAFGTIALAILLVGVLGVSLAYVFTGWTWAVVSTVLLFVSLIGVFVPIYAILPRADVGVREALPGTVLAAASWTLSGVLFRLYAATAESVRLYGFVGGVLLFLTWLYAAALFLLLGVTLNAVVADRVTTVDRPGG